MSDVAAAPVPAPAPVVSSQPDSHPYSARLCHVRIWPDFQGYGFNMHAEKGKPGQYIGKVDNGSPAEAAGLKEGDRIIEVNGTNVEQDNHQGVVQKIKSVSNETKLLVVDTDADTYFKSKSVSVSGSSSCVETITCPDRSATGKTGGSCTVHSHTHTPTHCTNSLLYTSIPPHYTGLHITGIIMASVSYLLLLLLLFTCSCKCIISLA